MTETLTGGYIIHQWPTLVRTRNTRHFYVEPKSGEWVEFNGPGAYEAVLNYLYDNLHDLSAFYEVRDYWGNKLSGDTPVDCPNHEGNYDCTPFCSICEGEQEYTPNN